MHCSNNQVGNRTSTANLNLASWPWARLAAARGGKYNQGADELETPYIKQFLGFLGIEDIEFVYAEGMAADDESRRQSLENANASIEALAHEPGHSATV